MMQTGDQNSLPAIMHEQGIDESFLLGTASEIKAFALAILEALEGPESPKNCLLYTSPSPRDKRQSRMPSSA